MSHLASEEKGETVPDNEGAEKKKFIQKAIKRPGALHRKLGVPQGKKIPAGKLAAAAKSKGLLGKEARFAQTLKTMH